MYCLQGPTKDNIPTSPLKQYTPAQNKQTLHTQPGVTYAHMTKQYFYASINIEQDQHTNQPHRQTSDIQYLKNLMKSLFGQMGTMLNLLTTMLTKLKLQKNSYNSPTA
jgi:hypothetical protein